MAIEGLRKWKFVDPDPEARGILLSDRIQRYVEKHNLLIEKSAFERANLKAASYSLTLNTKYYLEGKIYELHGAEYLCIPPNSFVVATTAEKVILPHYIAARFGLRVEYVYKGLLVGVGPQVDPGFEGYLGCPLHNLTDSPISIRAGAPFAWIDFAKTTRLAENKEMSEEVTFLKKVEQALGHGTEQEKMAVPGIDGYECLLYKSARVTFENSLPKGTTVVSSLKGLDQSVQGLSDKVDKWETTARRIELGALVGVIVLAITVLITFGVNFWLPSLKETLKLEQRIEVLELANEKARLDVVEPPIENPPAKQEQSTTTQQGHQEED